MRKSAHPLLTHFILHSLRFPQGRLILHRSTPCANLLNHSSIGWITAFIFRGLPSFVLLRVHRFTSFPQLLWTYFFKLFNSWFTLVIGKSGLLNLLPPVTDHRFSWWFVFYPSRAILWFRLKAVSNKPHDTCYPLKRGILPYPSILSLSSCSATYLLIASSFTSPIVST